MIRFINLSVTLQGHRILKDVTGSFPSTGFYGILGPSGSGKTTLFKVFLGLISHEGFLSIHGEKTAGFHRAQHADFRRRHFGFISQAPGLIEGFTVEENLLMASRVKGFFTSQETHYEISRVLQAVGAASLRQKPVDELSGGQSQLIALARALIGNPSIILADEPFSHLDSATEKHLLELLKKLSMQRLLLISSHQTEQLERFLDGALRLGEGPTYFANECGKIVPRFFMAQSYLFPTALLGKLLATIDAKDRASSKWIEFFMVAVFLLIAGLSMVNSIVQTQWMDAMANRMGAHLATVRPREETPATFLALTASAAYEMTDRYRALIQDVGAIVDYDFSPINQSNQWEVRWNQKGYALPQFTVESINRFLLPHEIPERPVVPPLEIDEVILGISQTQMFQLQIFFGTDHLASFFQMETPQVIVHLEQPLWHYQDRIALDWVGFYLSDTPTVVHTNPMFALHFFEQRMQFLMTDVLDRRELKPWTMTAIYFVRTDDVDRWLNAMRASVSDRLIHVERYGFRHNPSHCPVEENCMIQRWLLFTQTQRSIDPFGYPGLGPPQAYLPLNRESLVRYEEALAYGFSKKFYLSFSEPLLDQVRELEYKIDGERLHQTLSISGLYSGFYLDTASSKFTFLPSAKQGSGWKLSSAFVPSEAARPSFFWALVNHTSTMLSDGFTVQYFMKAAIPIAEWFEDDQLTILVDATSFEQALFHRFQWPRFSLVPEGYVVDMTTWAQAEDTQWELHDVQSQIRKDLAWLSFLFAFVLQTMIALGSLPLFFVLLHLFHFKTKRLQTALSPFVILGLSPSSIDGILAAHIASFLGRLALPLLGGFIAISWLIEAMMGEYFKSAIRYLPWFEMGLIIVIMALFSAIIFQTFRNKTHREKI